MITTGEPLTRAPSPLLESHLLLTYRLYPAWWGSYLTEPDAPRREVK